nr:aminotransferase class III-fold pyridoxal phosphate-dependent enzyme [Mannheimia haemolytica]
MDCLLAWSYINQHAHSAKKLKEKGLLCKETHDTVIRFAPPLVIEKFNLDWALEKIREVLA